MYNTCSSKTGLILLLLLLICSAHMTHFANIHKYSSNWKHTLFTQWELLSDRGELGYKSSGFSTFYTFGTISAGLVNPSYLISLHSSSAPSLQGRFPRGLMKRWRLATSCTGTVALCVLGQLLKSDLPVSSLQGTSTLNCLSSCVESYP